MPLLSISSKVDQIQSLLRDVENSLPYLPIEHQSLISNELERVAFQLMDWLQENSRQRAEHRPQQSGPEAELRPAAEVHGKDSLPGTADRLSRSGVWTWDLVHGTMQWSAELYELFRLDPAKKISDPQAFFEMIHAEDRRTATHEFDETIKRGGLFYLEFRMVCGDGKTIWLSSAGTVEHDVAGRPIQAVGINHDITDRKQMEEALRESIARERARAAELEALMDAVPAIIWISRDPQCKEMVGNRYGYEFLDMWEGANISKTAPDVELAHQPYRNFRNGEEIPNNELPMQIAASTGVGISDYEFDLVFDNGVTKNLLGNILPLTDQNGNPSGAVAAFVDISERTRMENELRENEARLQMWKNHINFWNKATNSFFWLLNPDSSYQDPILTDPGISGKSLEETRDWNWINIIHPEDREQTRTQWQNAIKQQSPFEVELRVWHETSKQYRWFSHRAVPLIKGGLLTGWIGASIDIQEHKEAEQALRESEQRFRVALSSAPMGVFTTDKDLRYTWVYNTGHNFTEKQMLGRRADEILAPEHVAELVDLQRSVIETGQSVQKEFKVRINGSWYHYIGTIDPVLNQRDQVTGLIGASFDITTQRQLEARQRENEIQMATQRRLLETREDERVNIAREIHDGPLQTLIGMVFDIHALKGQDVDETMKAGLQSLELSLKHSIQELRQFVNELRPPILIDLGLVEAIQRHATEACEKFPGLDLSLELDERINTVSERLSLTLYRVCQEALQNVLRHAKATKVVIHGSLETEQVVLSIRDNGIGFFATSDFTQLAANRHYGLTGMKERAEAVGGTLHLLSKPGAGTKIEISIPLQ